MRYIVDVTNKKIEFLESGTTEELKDIYEIFKGYEFSFSPEKKYDGNYITSVKELYEREKVPYNTLCPCNPANGGSGICGCIMGNTMVDPGFKMKSNFSDNTGNNTIYDNTIVSQSGIQKGNEYINLHNDSRN